MCLLSLIGAVALLGQDNSQQSTALRRAIWDRDVEQVRTLVNEGARVSAGWAVDAVNGRDGEKFRLQILTIILDSGTDVNGDSGALILTACRSGTFKMVEFLLDRGANAEQGVDSFSALHTAIVNNGPDVVQILLERGASATKPCASRHRENEPQRYGRQMIGPQRPPKRDIVVYPLQLAAYWGKLENAIVLVKHGAKINFQDLEGETALHTAALRPGNEEVIELLLENGADKRLKTVLGLTAFDVAKSKRNGGYMKLLQFHD